MRKSLRKSLVVAAVAAASVGLTAAPAMAGPPWTVSGAPAGPVAGTSDNTFLELTRGGSVVDTLRCDLSTVEATVSNGSNDGSTAVATIDSSTWEGCRDDNFGLTFDVAQVGTWNLFVDQDGPPSDVVGSVRNVVANISGPLCTATFQSGGTGGDSVPGYYTNATSTLTMDPDAGTNTLRVTAANCLGIIQVGDVARFNGDYALDAPVVITG